MRHRPTRSRATGLAVTVVLALAGSAGRGLAAQQRPESRPEPRAEQHLELGKMWTFERPPLAYLEQEYGFKPGPEWLDQLRLASVRFGNWCSASFVSPKGLVMTNHHCVRDKIAEAQQGAGKDWVANGFYAKDYESEHKLPQLTLSQLISMRDVTSEIDAGVTESDDAQAATKKREANQAKVVAAAREASPDLVPQVVKLHQGAAWLLYLYREYHDVRLVMAPHLQTAHFGGDPDNFTYPRYSIDFAFVRAWVDGKPADTSGHYFRWSRNGPKDGELVFVTGNPGSTGRQLTLAQMQHARDAEYPIQLDQLDTQLTILKDAASKSPELEGRVRTTILLWENSQKAVRGYLSGLLDPTLMAQKQKAEASLRAKVAADPELQRKYGDAWSRLEAVSRRKTELLPKLAYYAPGYSQVLGRATAIASASDEARDAREREAARKLALRGLDTRGSELQERLLRNSWALAAKWLGQQDPLVQALLGEGADAAVQKLRASKVKDQAFVKELVEGGKDAVAASEDFGIVVGRLLGELALRAQTEMRGLQAEEEALGAKIGQALFAVYGNMISPDATMTLRFTDGVVSGYPYNGTLAPWRTTFHGLYARNVEFDGAHPFDLPEPWLERRDRIDMTRSVCFVTTNDIIGGNSGSPVVNKELEVVGLIFDSNIEQLPNRFLYRDRTQRSVSVHVHAIMEALAKVYDAEALAAELLGTASGRDDAPPPRGKKE